MPDNIDAYDRQLNAQIAQYSDVEDMHEAAPAAHWIHSHHLKPRIKSVFNYDSIVEIYARYIAEAVTRSGLESVVSIGSGYGALEIDIVKFARSHNLPDFRITCLELSPILINRIEESAKAAGLKSFILGQQADLNQSLPVTGPVAAFMANHSLHHLVELEMIFDQIQRLLHSEGSFVTFDMIGRNGHMRWPETLAIVRQLWPQLPARLKKDHMFDRVDRWYENWDCSIEGFEGIRAQDILPLLVERFNFERFLATGGLADVFYDKRFGYNLNIDDPTDLAFLKNIQALEDDLLETGQIKPAFLFAVMRQKASQGWPQQPSFVGGVTPELAIRKADFESPLPTLEATSFVNPYPISEIPEIVTVDIDQTISFAAGGQGEAMLKWGWGLPEDAFTWSIGGESALAFKVNHAVTTIALFFIPYFPPAGQTGELTLSVDGVVQTVLRISAMSRDMFVKLRKPIQNGTPALIEFSYSRPRRPELDGEGDRRPLGFALISITLGCA